MTGKDPSVQVTATQRASAFESSENLSSKLLFDNWFRLLKLGKSGLKVLKLGKFELKVVFDYCCFSRTASLKVLGNEGKDKDGNS